MPRLLKRPTTTDCAKSGVALKNWPPPLSCFLAYEPASVNERSLRGWNSSLLWAAQKSCLKIFCGVCETLKKSRSEEHTSELQSLMRISYAVFCLKKKKIRQSMNIRQQHTPSNINLTETN